jgi:hypothetical protein
MALANVQRQQEHPNYAVARKRQEVRIYLCPKLQGLAHDQPRPSRDGD